MGISKTTPISSHSQIREVKSGVFGPSHKNFEQMSQNQIHQLQNCEGENIESELHAIEWKGTWDIERVFTSKFAHINCD